MDAAAATATIPINHAAIRAPDTGPDVAIADAPGVAAMGTTRGRRSSFLDGGPDRNGWECIGAILCACVRWVICAKHDTTVCAYAILTSYGRAFVGALDHVYVFLLWGIAGNCRAG